MYKSIIFDIGGVLVDFDPKAYLVDRLCNAEMEEKVYDLTFGSEEWQLLDAGKLSRYDGNQRMLEHARAEGCAFEVQGVLDDWMHILRPRLRMLELVRRLKNHGYCVYYLSNIPQDVLELLTERGVLTQFDGGVASCEVQVNKPDPQIYKALLKKYQLKASECIFIDDRLENVQAAFALGFAGIQMKDSVGTLSAALPPVTWRCAECSYNKQQPLPERFLRQGLLCVGGELTFPRSSGSSAGSPPAGWCSCTAPSP